MSVDSVDSRQLEQIKAVLMQQIQQQKQQQQQRADDRRLTDRLPTEFDLRERQRQDEIRRRQVSSTHSVCLACSFFCLRLDHVPVCWSVIFLWAEAVMQL